MHQCVPPREPRAGLSQPGHHHLISPLHPHQVCLAGCVLGIDVCVCVDNETNLMVEGATSVPDVLWQGCVVGGRRVGVYNFVSGPAQA